MKCSVFRVNVLYVYTSVPGKVDIMLAGLGITEVKVNMGCFEINCNGF